MKTSGELKEERALLIERAKDITDKAGNEQRELTDAEADVLEDLVTRAESMEDDIRTAEKKEEMVARSSRLQQSLQPPEPVAVRSIVMQSDGEPYNPAPRARIEHQMRSGKMRAFPNTYDGELAAYRSGMWVRAFMMRDSKAEQWCLENGLSRRAQGISTDSAGGALVPPSDLQTAVINLRELYGVFRNEVDVVPMSTDSITWPRAVGGLTATWEVENTALTETDQVFDNVSLSAKKLAAITRISTELAEDSVIMIADFLARQMAEAFAKEEDEAGFTGAGGATNGGILGLSVKINDGTHTASLVDAPGGAHDSFADIDLASIHALMGVLPQYARPNAKWYCSQYAKDATFVRLQAAGGGNTISTIGDGPPRDNFLGYPIVTSQVLSSQATDFSDGDLFEIFFGDLRMAAVMAERRGMTARTDESVYFASDQLAVKMTERIDISVHDLGDTSTAGPIVALVSN